jgi:hypothetical protein
MKMQHELMEEATAAEVGGAGGGGVSADSSAVPAGGDSAAGSEVNWDALDQEITAMDEGAPAVVEPVKAAPSESVPPAAPAAEATPVEPVAPEQPAAAVVAQEPAQSAAPVQPAQPAPTVSPQELRGKYLQDLETAYGLSDADAQALLTEPEKVLPKLAAKMHLYVVDTVISAVMQNLPNAIQHIQQTKQTYSDAENAFFTAWPALKDQKYRQTVYNSVAAYRQLNPTAPMNEVIRAAGLNALITLRMPIPQELLGQPAQAPVAPPPAFTPANPGRGVGGPTQVQSDNPFTTLAQEFIDMDRA